MKILLALLFAAGLFFYSCSSNEKKDELFSKSDAVSETVFFDSTESLDQQSNGDVKEEEQVKTGCTSNEDCEDGLVCDCHGECVKAGFKECEEDINCGSENYCDPCTKTCFPQKKLCEVCKKSVCDPVTGMCEEMGNQCADFGACIDFIDGNSYCGKACLSDAGCPVGFKCAEIPGISEKQCIPISGDCTKVFQCKDDSECDPGEICSDTVKVCVKGCTDDDECPPDKVCSAYRCKEPCDDINNPCPEGQICKDGHCKIEGGCVDWKDCEEKETYCDPETHTCKPGCLTDLDCKQASKICKDGKCVKKGCKAAWSCAYGQVCDLETGDCVEPEGPYCEPCDPNDENACGGGGNMCVSFQDKDGNDKGSYCLVACSSDPKNVCPQGYECVEVKDQNGQVKGKVCARACFEEPVR